MGGIFKIVRRYLWTLIPFVVCSLLSLLYMNLEPAEYPHPMYPNRSQEILDYFTSRWFMIGIIISSVLAAILAIDDMFSYLGKFFERRQLKKME